MCFPKIFLATLHSRILCLRTSSVFRVFIYFFFWSTPLVIKVSSGEKKNRGSVFISLLLFFEYERWNYAVAVNSERYYHSNCYEISIFILQPVQCKCKPLFFFFEKLRFTCPARASTNVLKDLFSNRLISRNWYDVFHLVEKKKQIPN